MGTENHDRLTNDLLKACEAQHEAIDRLFAMLVGRDDGFFPTESGQPWEALQLGFAAIAKARGALNERKPTMRLHTTTDDIYDSTMTHQDTDCRQEVADLCYLVRDLQVEVERLRSQINGLAAYHN